MTFRAETSEGIIKQITGIGFSPLSLIPYFAMSLGLFALKSAWVSFAIYHGLVLITLLSTKDRGFWKSLIEGWNPRMGLGAIAFGLVGGMVLFFLAPLAGINQAVLEPGLAKLGLHGTPWLLFVFYHSLVNPWFEELLWRGKLGSDSRWPVLNDFLFSGYHMLVLVLFLDWVWMLLAFGILTLAGWFWRQLRQHFKGLLLPVLSHMAADSSIMAVAYLLSIFSPPLLF